MMRGAIPVLLAVALLAAWAAWAALSDSASPAPVADPVPSASGEPAPASSALLPDPSDRVALASVPGAGAGHHEDGTIVRVRLVSIPVPLSFEPLPMLRISPASLSRGGSGRSREAPFGKEDGSATIQATPGEWSVEVVSLGGVVARLEVVLGEGVNEISLDAAMMPGFSGRVVDEQGRELVGATIVLQLGDGSTTRMGPLAGASVQGGSMRTTTAADGHYHLPLISAAGMYALRASLSGWRQAELRPLALDGSGIRRLRDLTLRRGRSVTGQVVDEQGLPVQGCEVSLSIDAEPGQRSVSTDGDGRFALRDLPHGPGKVWTRDAQSVNAGIVFDETGDVDLTLILAAGGWIDATLVFEGGSPASGMMLFGFPLGRGGENAAGESLAGPRQGITGRDGRVRLGPFSAGPVRLLEPVKSFVERTVDSPSEVEIVIPTPLAWSTMLRFLDARTRDPVSVAGSLDIRWGSDGLGGGVHSLEVQPDANGEWVLDYPTPAGVDVSLHVVFPGYRSAEVDDLRAESNGGRHLRVVLEPDLPLRIAVTGGAGEALAGAQVTLLWSSGEVDVRKALSTGQYSASARSPFDGEGALEESVETGGDGLALFGRLHDGPLIWSITAPGHYPQTGRVESLTAQASATESTDSSPALSFQLRAAPIPDGR